MKYTKQQKIYIESSAPKDADKKAVEMIGRLEKIIEAQTRRLVCYRTGTPPPEWTFKVLDQAREAGIIR